MSDLIVAGFDDGHTAFLARAALARLQGKLSMSSQDLAVLTLKREHEVSLQLEVGLAEGLEAHESFWGLLANLLFSVHGASARAESEADTRLEAIGVVPTFRQGVRKKVRPGTAALLVLLSEAKARDEVLAVLRGFQGSIHRTKLIGDHRSSWERSLLETG